jgi:GTP-dependent dephospho-CoA kinase
MTVYTVTPQLRVKLKEPFGILVKGSFEETMTKLKELIQKQKPPKIISVGDTVSKNMHEYKIKPQVTIIDNLCMRKKIDSGLYNAETVNVSNPQGTITQQAIDAVKTALVSSEPTQIIVEGEEDLLTLVAVTYAPEKSIVVYGQPYEGIVIVTVTPEKRLEAQDFLKAMEKGSKS